MLYKKFRLCAQVVGCITIGLLAVYGLVAVLGGGDLVAWASGRAAVAADSVPSVMNYQGHLQDDSGVPLSGTHTMTFRIYDSVVAPTTAALWTETHTDVTVRAGYFNVLLGYSNPLPDTLFVAPDRYIGVTVAPYDEMTPRQRFASVPYAFQAERAFGLSAADGAPADAVVVDDAGNVGIGTAPFSKLHVAGDYYGEGHLHLYALEGAGANGTAAVLAHDFTDSSNIDLAFSTKDGAVGREVMRLTSAGNVGIGTTTPRSTLHVAGDYYGEGHLHLYANEGEGESGTATVLAHDFTDSSNIDLAFSTKDGAVGREVMRLTSDGDVQVSGDLNVIGNITNFSVTDYVVDCGWTYPQSTQMTLVGNSICFLTGVAHNTYGWTSNLNNATCRIERSGDYWTLRADNELELGYLYTEVWCWASCLSW